MSTSLRILTVCCLFAIGWCLNITNCDIPKCVLFRTGTPAHNTMNQLNETMETKVIALAIRRVQSSNDTRCYVDTKEFIDAFKFDHRRPFYAVLGLYCITEVEVYFTDYEGPYFHNVMGYLQVSKCIISQRQLYPFQNRFKIFMVNYVEATYPPLGKEYCDGSLVNKNSCKVWNTLEGILYSPLNFANSVQSIKELFICNQTFPSMKEMIFQNFPMHKHLSQLPEMFPRLQLLSILNGNLTHPPNFPWNDELLNLSINMSRTEIEQEKFLGLTHVDIGNNYHVRELSLIENNITDLSTHTFKGFLHKIVLSRNGLKLLSELTFRKLQGFQHLDLSSNELLVIPKNCFQGLGELRHLNFKMNQISHIPQDLFSDNIKLVFLDFSHNRISKIESNTFSHLRSLKELHLEHNMITSIEVNMFPSKSVEFKKLILDRNPFSVVPQALFSLLSLDLISFQHTNADFVNFTQTVLEFARNLNQIEANNRTFSNENPNSMHRQQIDESHKGKLDFTGSKISNLKINNYDIFDRKTNGEEELHKSLLSMFKLFEFNLNNNPLRCDCGINQISKVIKHMIEENIINHDNTFNKWTCHWPNEFKNRHILEIPERDTYCEIQHERCPLNCTCYVRSISEIIIVDCSNQAFMSLPEVLPIRKLDLWFQRNNITTLANRKYLEQIHSLDLSDNNLAQIEQGVFNKMENVQKLYLNYNSLVSLPSEIQAHFSGKLRIEDNPFKCDCNTVWLKHWMINNPNITIDSQAVRCNVDKENEKGKKFISVPDEEFVCLVDFDSYNKVLVPSVIASVIAGLMIITICLMYIYRLEIKILLYIYLGFHPFDQDKDCKEIIDVLVIHSPESTNWVMENIVEYLDFCTAHYLVCEMMRDFVAGFSYQENIATLVKHSKRIIIVLSKEFMDEDILKIAWNETQDKIKILKSNYAIVVSIDVNLKDIYNKDLQQYIKRGRYIDANQSLFQEKLLYSLPQFKDEDTRAKSLPDIKYLIQNMYGNDNRDAEMYERHAFLSYCEKDMGYVMNELRPIIEDNGFTLCLPDRDFVPGAPKEENVLKAIDNCLHTIFLLSGDQLDNEWSVFTFRSASEKSMREKCNHLIVVLGDDVNIETMGEDVRAYVKTHVSLKIGEKGFIKRLLNALPDVKDHELYIKNDENNFVNFENLHHTKMENGLKVVDIIANVENEGKKNGHVKCQNGKINGHVQLTDIQLDCLSLQYQNRAFQNDGIDAMDFNENERK